MVFGVEETGEFRWGRIEREKAVIRFGKRGENWKNMKEQGSALDRGPGIIVEIMKLRRDFSLFSYAAKRYLK